MIGVVWGMAAAPAVPPLTGVVPGPVALARGVLAAEPSGFAGGVADGVRWAVNLRLGRMPALIRRWLSIS